MLSGTKLRKIAQVSTDPKENVAAPNALKQNKQNTFFCIVGQKIPVQKSFLFTSRLQMWSIK